MPESWLQVAVILAAVVPGFVYQVSRRKVAGPGPDEADFSVRVLRSIAASVVFASLYAVAFGPTITTYLTDPARVVASSRSVGVAALALIVGIPWVAARAVFYLTTSAWLQRLRTWVRVRLRLQRQYDPTPSAWDFAFSARRPGWVRVRTQDGVWIGGWFGTDSFASSHPDPHELYLEIGYALNDDGTFTGEVSAPDGVFLRCQEAVLVDFIADEPDTESTSEED